MTEDVAGIVAVYGGPPQEGMVQLSRLDIMRIEDKLIRQNNPTGKDYVRAVLHITRLALLGSAAKPPMLYALAIAEQERANRGPEPYYGYIDAGFGESTMANGRHITSTYDAPMPADPVDWTKVMLLGDPGMSDEAIED